jgi:hypothetical protein
MGLIGTAILEAMDPMSTLDNKNSEWLSRIVSFGSHWGMVLPSRNDIMLKGYRTH